MANVSERGAAFAFLLYASAIVSAQLRYTISEELERGAFVGNVVEDLRLNIWDLSARRVRFISDEMKQYLQVNMDNGHLFVSERIDREQMCKQNPICFLSFQIVLYDPEKMHSITVEILDVNDNSPTFQKNEFFLQINEQIAPGARFPFERAHDPDIGTNAINTYQISANEHFGIKVQTRREGTKTAELLLEKSLDREQQAAFQLTLTAIDGGTPRKSGTARIVISVLDANDNAPQFDHDTYSVTLAENVPKGTLVTKLNAVDLDEGSNAELTYSFTNHVPQSIRELFKLDPLTGQINVEGLLNYEESRFYELDMEAIDHGSPGLTDRTKVIITLTDLNDNAPVINIISVSRTVPENAQPGTVVATISMSDLDSGENGQVHCQIPPEFPFTLERSSRNNYKLITNDVLDREATTMYNISIAAWDGGSPPRSTQRFVLISVSDKNDNAPRFTQSSYNVYVMENNTPGSSIFSVSAVDPDIDQNGDVIYALLDQGFAFRCVTINSKNGQVYALISFDYEELKHFQIEVEARDSGSPAMRSTTTLNVIILDLNDNAPIIVSPLILNGSTSVEITPQLVYPGYLITKITAMDADSGQNARLSYQLFELTDPTQFTVDILSGEITAIRSFPAQELIASRIVICVKDNGEPSLSSTATIFFSILPNSTGQSSKTSVRLREWKDIFDLNLYLILILGSTSTLFLVTIIFLVVVKCKQDRNMGERHSSGYCCSYPRNSDTDFNQRHSAIEDSSYNTERYRYAVCLSPESAKSDFLFLKPCHPTLPFTEPSFFENSGNK